MIGRARHPSWSELNRLADDELDPDARDGALEHLERCPNCTRGLSFLRDVRETAGDMRHPGPPRELLEDILRDRAEGRRVILPVGGAAEARRRRRIPVAASIAAFVGAAGLLSVLLAPDVDAGASDLTFEPAHPVPGQEVRISYRPAIELAGEPELRLRVRVRQPHSDPPRETLGAYEEVVLVPEGDGRYGGALLLRPDFAYGVMSVESLAGDRLDDRHGHLWGLSAYASDGVPSFASLRQEYLVLQQRSWPEAEEVLRRMTLLYPDRAEGWSILLLHERPTQTRGEAAASLVTARQIFRDLQGQLAGREASPEEVAAMARLATLLGETDVLVAWLARLAELDPAHPLVLSSRVAGNFPAEMPASRYLERLWTDEGLRDATVYRTGFRMAVMDGDGVAARRWAIRGLPLDDDHLWVRDAALALLASPETRERGIEAMRDLVEHMGEAPDADRPLHLTRPEAERESRGLRAALLASLGQALLDSGEPAAAIAELDAADELGVWVPALYRARLEARLELGDTAGALPDFFRLDVDPVVPREEVDRLRERLPVLSSAARYRGRARAEREIRARVLADQQNRGLPRFDLRTETGQARPIASLLAGRPTVLMMWDRRVFGSPDVVAEVQRARDILAGGPGQLLWVTPEPDSDALRSFTRAAGLDLPAYQDPGSEFALELGEWGVRGYFVIDRAGKIRARTHSLMEAVRHLEILRLGSRDTA